MALDTPKDSSEQINPELDVQAELASWVMERVDKWRLYRNTMFQKRWAEYYRLWRGFWDPADKNKDAERSKLIAPALQQAIEMTVAEMEEATFGRATWVDISDCYDPPEKVDILALRDRLLDEFDRHGVKGAVAETYLNSALYGNGIGKVMIGRDDADNFKVWLEPIAPQNFVIDPSARTVDEALGCAHEIPVPKHKVLKKQSDGLYYDTPIGDFHGEPEMFNTSGEPIHRVMDDTDICFVTEYHGLVPTRLLLGKDPDEGEEGDESIKEFRLRDPALGSGNTPLEEDDEDMTEAIVTIGNKMILLRAVANPYESPIQKQDRAIIAYQHETVPNQFWGRGVSEKGYNPQKALDAELRARIDALGLLTYPVMGADATRIPRGMDLKIRPGKLFLTNGRPSEVLEPIIFGNLNPATFQQSSDLERMVQMGTGAMDSAISSEDNQRNGTASGMSMMYSGFVKRSKRTMQNVERNFLTKLVQKALWRYMQFDPENFPQEFKFEVHSAMGIMAREFEQATLTQLLQVVPPESAIFNVVLKGIIENGATPNKGELLKALDQMNQPDPQKQQMAQMAQQLQMENLQLENEKLKAEVSKGQTTAGLNQAKTQHVKVQTVLEPQKVQALNDQNKISAAKVQSGHQLGVAGQVHMHVKGLMDHAMGHHQIDSKERTDRLKLQAAKNKPKPKGK